jgi:hypothetical protein
MRVRIHRWQKMYLGEWRDGPTVLYLVEDELGSSNIPAPTLVKPNTWRVSEPIPSSGSCGPNGTNRRVIGVAGSV